MSDARPLRARATDRPPLGALLLRHRPLLTRPQPGSVMLAPLGAARPRGHPGGRWHLDAPWRVDELEPKPEVVLEAAPDQVADVVRPDTPDMGEPEATTSTSPLAPVRAPSVLERRADAATRAKPDVTRTAVAGPTAGPVASGAAGQPIAADAAARQAWHETPVRLIAREPEVPAPTARMQSSDEAGATLASSSALAPALGPADAPTGAPPAKGPSAEAPPTEALRGQAAVPVVAASAAPRRAVEASAAPANPGAGAPAGRPAIAPVEEHRSRRPPPRVERAVPPAPDRTPPVGPAIATPDAARSASVAVNGEVLIDPTALFANHAEGRSPLDWFARLEAVEAARQQTKPGQASATMGPAAAPLTTSVPGTRPASPVPASRPAQPRLVPVRPAAPAEQIAATTRAFLRPLVGIDPATVEVRRDPAAAGRAAALDADAVAEQGRIAIGAPAPEREPAGLALLAHELTHVARARRPGFVPLILRDPAPAPRPGAGSPGTRAMTRVPAEESTAPAAAGRPGRPASRVDAGGAPDAPATAPSRVERSIDAVAAADEEMAAAEVEARVLARATAARETTAAAAASAPDRWAGLPAPWEPMPALPDEPAQAVETIAPSPAAVHAAAREAAVTFPAVAPAATSASPVPQRAARDRQLPAPDRADPDADDFAATAAAAMPSPDAPDLDHLARQVYAVLKRRIAAERRRNGG